MTREEILAFLPATWACPTNFGALNYHVPTLAWLRGPFYSFFLQRRFDLGLNKWQKRYECRDFTRDYAADAIDCWARTNTIADDDALAVGEIWIPNGVQGHAVAVVFTENGLQFIDPQNNSLWLMSSDVLAQRYFLRF